MVKLHFSRNCKIKNNLLRHIHYLYIIILIQINYFVSENAVLSYVTKMIEDAELDLGHFLRQCYHVRNKKEPWKQQIFSLKILIWHWANFDQFNPWLSIDTCKSAIITSQIQPVLQYIDLIVLVLLFRLLSF